MNEEECTLLRRAIVEVGVAVNALGDDRWLAS